MYILKEIIKSDCLADTVSSYFLYHFNFRLIKYNKPVYHRNGRDQIFLYIYINLLLL